VPITMYHASVPVFQRGLTNLSAILRKGEEHARAQGIDAAQLIAARLAPDMFPLSRQVQSASDTAKGCGARLAGVQVPSYPDTETTFAQLQMRVAMTIEFLQGLDPALIEGSEERTITLKLRGGDMSFRGQSYLFNFALPNFFFHVTTAYDILRHNGVPLGKQDYLGPS
jgi:uncharacterized protein